MRYCSVKVCKSSDLDEGISFHQIPKNCGPEWLKVINPSSGIPGGGWTAIKYSVICSLHFSKENMKCYIIIPPPPLSYTTNKNKNKYTCFPHGITSIEKKIYKDSLKLVLNLYFHLKDSYNGRKLRPGSIPISTYSAAVEKQVV